VIRIALGTALAIVLLVGPAASAAPTRSQGDAYTSLLALYKAAAATVSADRARCAQMVPDLTKFLKAHPQAKTLSAATAALEPLQHGQDETKYAAAVHAAGSKISAAGAACKKTAQLTGPLSVFRPLSYPHIIVLP
jgi:hypothetical protein